MHVDRKRARERTRRLPSHPRLCALAPPAAMSRILLAAALVALAGCDVDIPERRPTARERIAARAKDSPLR